MCPRFALTAAAIGGLFAAGGFIGQWARALADALGPALGHRHGLYLGAAYSELNSYASLPSWAWSASYSPACMLGGRADRPLPPDSRGLQRCPGCPCPGGLRPARLRRADGAGPRLDRGGLRRSCFQPSPGSRTGWISPGCAAPPGWRRCWCWCGCCRDPGLPISRQP